MTTCYGRPIYNTSTLFTNSVMLKAFIGEQQLKQAARVCRKGQITLL